MEHYICVTCGTQYPASATPPAGCPICEDDRQYVNPAGQQWTTLAAVRRQYRNTFQELEPGVTAITPERRPELSDAEARGLKPKFGIGQTAHLIETPRGNVLWDCVALLDDETVAAITERGGLVALGLSHPHYYTTIVEWSRAFGDIPVYIHAADAEWVMRPDPCIRFWDGETVELVPGAPNATMIRCGGHFPGASVLHWPAAAEGHGALFSGDTIQVVADPRWVSFMYSYPDLIPLDAAAVRQIVEAVAPFPFERVYGAFGGIVRADGLGAVRRSAERYIKHIGG
jgi:glyoxylase-like metal-dependent hydrolase (beta-lactamase superfamily II)